MTESKVQLTDFISLENKNGLITVDPEGIRNTVLALRKKRKELLDQVGFLMGQAQRAAEQAKELENLLGESVPVAEDDAPSQA